MGCTLCMAPRRREMVLMEVLLISFSCEGAVSYLSCHLVSPAQESPFCEDRPVARATFPKCLISCRLHFAGQTSQHEDVAGQDKTLKSRIIGSATGVIQVRCRRCIYART